MKGPDQLYETALKVTVATKKTFLKIEIYSGQKNDYFFSLLLQGGLPFHRILSSIENKGSQSVWRRFIRGLVFRNTDFDDLDLGKIASQNNSLQMFCYTMAHSSGTVNEVAVTLLARVCSARQSSGTCKSTGNINFIAALANILTFMWAA